SATAQSNVDMERMKRDINIMENILQELFKAEGEFISNRYLLTGDGIQGTYLSDYGILFRIPGTESGFKGAVTLTDSGNSEPTYTFKYGDNSDKEITEESIVNRISEFLRDYASTIGQLSANDRVTVIYNARPGHLTFTFISNSDEEFEDYGLPTISVTAQKSDLQAVRSGDISKETFNERLKVSKTAAN